MPQSSKKLGYILAFAIGTGAAAAHSAYQTIVPSIDDDAVCTVQPNSKGDVHVSVRTPDQTHVFFTSQNALKTTINDGHADYMLTGDFQDTTVNGGKRYFRIDMDKQLCQIHESSAGDGYQETNYRTVESATELREIADNNPLKRTDPSGALKSVLDASPRFN